MAFYPALGGTFMVYSRIIRDCLVLPTTIFLYRRRRLRTRAEKGKWKKINEEPVAPLCVLCVSLPSITASVNQPGFQFPIPNSDLNSSLLHLPAQLPWFSSDAPLSA